MTTVDSVLYYECMKRYDIHQCIEMVVHDVFIDILHTQSNVVDNISLGNKRFCWRPKYHGNVFE